MRLDSEIAQEGPSLLTDRLRQEARSISALVRSATDRAGGLRPVARLCGVSPNTVRQTGSGEAKLTTLAKVELHLTHAGLMHNDSKAGRASTLTGERLVPLHEALLESPIAARAYAEWLEGRGQWPVDDTSQDAAWSERMGRRGCVNLARNGIFFMRYHGTALRTRLARNGWIDMVDGVTARRTASQARYQLCIDTNAPIASYAYFDVEDLRTPVPCYVLTLPFKCPNGSLLITTVSERHLF